MMTDHERAMARARDHVLALHREEAIATQADYSPERRLRYDVLAQLARLQASCDRERVALAGDREQINQTRIETRNALIKFGKVTKLIMVGFAIALTIIAGFGYYLIDRNREAIEVGCLVVVRVVRDSGANSGKPKETPAAQASARNTARFYKTLLGMMSPSDREATLRDLAIVRKAGGPIPEPQCEEVARDPDKVRRETLQKRARP